MSILDDVLKEEYDRMSRISENIVSEIESLPKGYLSEKKINGHVYHYLQKREDGKVKSRYIKEQDVESYRVLIRRRKELEESLKNLEREKKKVERVVGKDV
ncbi:MAG: hypothetical protein Q4C25_04125 [Bacillota bacterium]|nr:hypothetical protein [Bacillota bacterium]